MFYVPERFDVAVTAVGHRFGEVVYPAPDDEPLLCPQSSPRDMGHIAGLVWLRRVEPLVSRETPKACELALMADLMAVEGHAGEMMVWRRLPEMARDEGTGFWRGTFRLEVYQMTKEPVV